MPTIKASKAERPVKCRWCNEMIPTGTKDVICFSLYYDRMGRNLYFHKNCLNEMNEVAKNDVQRPE